MPKLFTLDVYSEFGVISNINKIAYDNHLYRKLFTGGKSLW